MGDRKLEHRQSRVNIAPLIVLEATIFETRKQPNGIGVTQSLDVGITTTRVEMIVAPNMDFVKMGVLFGFATKLGNGSSGVLARRNLSRNSTRPVITTRVVGTPQMVFTNPIITIHVK